MTINIDHYQDSGTLTSGRGATTTLIDNIGWMANGSPEGLLHPIYPIIRPTESGVPFSYCYDYYTFFRFSGSYIAAARPRIDINISPIPHTRDATLTKTPFDIDFTEEEVSITTIVTSNGTLVTDFTYNNQTKTLTIASVPLSVPSSGNVILPISLTINYTTPGVPLWNTSVKPIVGNARMYYQLTEKYATPAAVHNGGLILHEDTLITLYPRLSTTGPNANLSYPHYLAANTTYYTEYLHTRIYLNTIQQYGNIGPISFKCYVDEYESTDL